MRGRFPLFLSAEQAAQNAPQKSRRFPNDDAHFLFLPSLPQAAQPAGDQQKSHNKHQTSHRKNGGNEDAHTQGQRTDAHAPPAIPPSHNNPPLLQYTHLYVPVFRPEPLPRHEHDAKKRRLGSDPETALFHWGAEGIFSLSV